MSDIDIDALKQEVISLLVSSKGGLTEQELLDDFRLYHSNRDLPYKELGYPSLIDLLRAWPDVCHIQTRGKNQPSKILAVEEKNTKHILSLVKGQRASKKAYRGQTVARGHTRGGKSKDGQHPRSTHDDNHSSDNGFDRTGQFARSSFNSARAKAGNTAVRGMTNLRANIHNQQYSNQQRIGFKRSNSGFSFELNSKTKSDVSEE